MKFKFSLEKVLTQRNLQVDLERRRFLDKKNEFDQETEKLNQMIQLKHDTINQRQQEVESNHHWQNDVSMMNEFLTGQDLRIENQNKRLKSLEKEVEVLRQILLKALTEARMVEKLKEKKKAEFIKEMLDSEQKELDEIVSIRSGRHQTKTGTE